MRKLLLLLLTLAFMVGCGGDGDDGIFDNSVAENFARRFVSALNSDNVNNVAPLVSTSYFEDCFDRSDFLNAYRDDVNSGFDYDLEILDVFDEEVFENEASFVIRLRDRDSGQEDQFRVFIRRESGVWRLYGNQDCNEFSATKPGQKKEITSLGQLVISN